jgi:menaquinone-dependent protoporphyrinogen oxidase
MTSILVVYGTGEGQTEKVANRIGETLRERGHDATVLDATAISTDYSVVRHDAVLVGSSIHAGKHQSSITTFVREHHHSLSTRPTGFFQVSLSSATDDAERQAEAAGYVESFIDETDWHPDRIGLFGGALRYSEYGFLKRLLMKRIAKGATGDTDTARDYEYTDWDEVAQFTNDFAAFVEGRLGIAPPEAAE